MKPLHELTLNEQTLMPKDWLRRRMTRLVNKGFKGGGFRPVVMLTDIAKWFGVGYDLIRHMENGRVPITDKWQVQLSQFFYLLDMGIIVLEVDMKNRHKRWTRNTQEPVPCKQPMPRVDFAAAKLKFD
jgi:hypothetical protein